MQSRHYFHHVRRNSLRVLGVVCAVLLPIAASCAGSQDYVKKPIPNSPNAKTAKSWGPIYSKFYQRVIVDDYKKYGFHNPKWDSDAIKFLDHFTKLKPDPNNPAVIESFYKEGEALIEAGCNDPVVLFAYGAILFDNGRRASAEEPLTRCMEGFKKSSYHKCRARWAPLDLADIRTFEKHMKDEDNRELCDLAMQWTIESFRDGSYQNGEQRIALSNFCRDYMNRQTNFRNNWSDVLAALEKNPPTDPYIDKVARARCHIKMGWKARGGGFADTVTEEGWRVFSEELGKACKLLKEAWKLHPELPEAPYEMMQVARADCAPGETPRMWFDRAMAAQMDYIPAYNELIFSKSKIWDDDPNGLYEFGVECVKTGRYDTNVPVQFMAVLNSLSNDTGNTSYWTMPKSIKFLDIMFDGYEKSGSMGSKEHVLSKKAAIAWYCNRYTLAKDIINKLGDKIDEAPFIEIKNVPFSEIKGEIFAFASPQGPELINARSLSNSKKYDKALVIYDKVSKIDLGDDLANTFIKETASKLRSAGALATGGWAEIPVDDISRDWYRWSGDWTLGSDGWLWGSGSGEEWTEISSKSIFTQAIDLEAELNVGGSGSNNACAGIGFLPLDITGFGPYIAKVSLAQKSVEFGEEYKSGLVLVKDLDVPKQCKLQIQVWAGIVNVYLDGKPMKTGYLIHVPMNLSDRCRVVLAVKGPKAGFRSIKIRKLTSKPEEMGNVEPYDADAFLKQHGIK